MPIDMSAAVKAPPKKATRTGNPVGRPPKAPSASVRELREQGLIGVAQAAQGLCLLTNQYADAAAIGMHHEPIVKEIAAFADTNDWVAKGVDVLIKAGPVTGILTALIPFAIQIAVNHGWMKAPSIPGSSIVPPEVLEAQTKASMLRMQAQAMREQQEAIRDAERAQQEYEQFLNARETTQFIPETANGSAVYAQ